MVVRVSRRRRADDPGPRMLLFAVGAVLALAGILFDIAWLVAVATVILGVGMVLGIVARRRDDHGEDLDEDTT
jgi:hypothetical protein